MKKLFLILAVIGLVSFGCKKEADKDNSTIAKYVGTVNGSYVAKDASIKVSKDLDPSQLATRNWIMYAKNSPFYGGQSLALVTGKEFITGSAAQQWWSVPANNPIAFAANQAVYSNLTPAEPVRLVMEGKDGSNNIAYLGVLDFDPTAAQFPLAVNSVSLGDKLIVNADGLTSKPGGSSISVSVLLQVAPVDIQATETTSQLSSLNEGQSTGVTGSLDFQHIKYGYSSLTSQIPVGTGDCTVFNSTASKIIGITIIITFPPLPSAPGVLGSSIQLTTQAAGPGQFLKIILTTPKLGWYDSATIGVNDQDITVHEQTISVDGQDNQGGNNGGGNNGNGGNGNNNGGQNPSIVYGIPLNSSVNYMIPLSSISLNIDGMGYVSISSGDITDMGALDLISILQSTPNYLGDPPVFNSFSPSVQLIQGHSYVIRYNASPYTYGLFYVTGAQSGNFTITYQGPFNN